MRFLAAAVWPFATLDRILTDRRIRAAQLEHAADAARVAAVSRGEYFRPTFADEMERDCDS